MNILKHKDEKLFERAPAPQVLKVVYNTVRPATYDYRALKVFFEDGSSVKINNVDRYQLEHALLMALAERAYTDRYELEDPDYDGSDFHNKLNDLYDSIEEEVDECSTFKSFKNKSSKKPRTSKIAETLKNLEKEDSKKCCQAYVRPNKPFKDFTQSEKRAYWRESNRKRKSRI